MSKPFTAVIVVLLAIALLPLGGLLLAPLLLLAPFAFAALLLVGILRLLGVVLVGAFAMIFAALGFALLLVGGALVFGLALGLLHLLLPVLLLAGIVWLISRAARPNVPRILPPTAIS